MVLFVAFKGTGNSSHRLVSGLNGEKLFLTNSFSGLKKDIDNVDGKYSAIYMFGLDKTLKGNIRVERSAVCDSQVLSSVLDIEFIVQRLKEQGLDAEPGNSPKHTLCNEAYWYMLKKYNGRVVFFHIPSIRYINEEFINRFGTVL